MPFDFRRAQLVARVWFEACDELQRFELSTKVFARPYGWVFFGQAVNTVRDSMIVGLPWILVDRVNGEIYVQSAGVPLDVGLAKYEATIPTARLAMTPEIPAGVDAQFPGRHATIDADKPVNVDAFPSWKSRRRLRDRH